MRLYLIRHAHTVQEPDHLSARWNLSAEGILQSQELAKCHFWSAIDCIILSSEPKSRLTVESVIEERNLPTWIEGRFDELRRPSWVGEYQDRVRLAFQRPNESAGDWEPARDALARFLDGITLLRKRFVHGNLALIGHGLTFSLYRAHLLGQNQPSFEDWARMEFAAVAVVNPITERLLQDFTSVSKLASTI